MPPLTASALARLEAAGTGVPIEPGRWLAGSDPFSSTDRDPAWGAGALVVCAGSAVGLALGRDGRMVGTGLYPAGTAGAAARADAPAAGLRGLQAGRAVHVAAGTLELLLRSDPALAAAVAGAWADEAAMARRCLTWAALLDSRGRTAAWLLLLAERLGRPESGGGLGIGPVLPQEDLASMTGLSRETVNRALRSLAGQGLVRLGRRRYAIPDPHALLALTEA